MPFQQQMTSYSTDDSIEDSDHRTSIPRHPRILLQIPFDHLALMAVNSCHMKMTNAQIQMEAITHMIV
jgi:hypothetical protein